MRIWILSLFMLFSTPSPSQAALVDTVGFDPEIVSQNMGHRWGAHDVRFLTLGYALEHFNPVGHLLEALDGERFAVYELTLSLTKGNQSYALICKVYDLITQGLLVLYSGEDCAVWSSVGQRLSSQAAERALGSGYRVNQMFIYK